MVMDSINISQVVSNLEEAMDKDDSALLLFSSRYMKFAKQMAIIITMILARLLSVFF